MAAADWSGVNAGYPESSNPTHSEPVVSGASSGVARALNAMGAILSVALVAGLGHWGYTLVMRDVTGIPVVRALEGPTRVQPDDPGGVAADYQGLAVNTIAAEGQAEGPADSVTLAPAPLALADEDRPAVSGAEVAAAPEAEADEMQPAAEAAEPDPMAVALALAEAVSEGVAPLTGETADLSMTDVPDAAAPEEEMAAVELIPASVPGVVLSPRPAPRPEDLVTRAELSTAPDIRPFVETAASPAEVDPATIPAGTRLAQLGAFDSEEVARVEWDRLMIRFEDILESKSRVIERAQSGGKTFYRLRAMGFDDLSDARRFCAAMLAGQAPCIPVETR